MCEYLRCEVVYGACRRFFWSINYTLTHHPVTIVDIGDTSGVIELHLMALLVASEALGAGASSLADGAANAALVRAGLPLGDFGKLRLWGAVGWGWVFAPLSGAFIERLPSSARWAASFGMHTALLAATAGVCATLDHSTRRPLKRSKSDPPGGDIELHAADRRSALSKLMDVASRPYIALTYVTFYICSLFMGCVETYLFLYLDTLGGGELVMGVALTFTCLSEVAVFFFAQRVMSALGVPRSVALVLLCFSLRFSFYWLLPLVGTTWAVLPVQLLHGITFGLFYSLGQKFTHEASPPGLHATCQGLFSGIVSAGMFSGALAGGALFGWSPRRMWLTLAALALVAAPVYYCLALRLLGDDADGAKSAISSKTAEVVAEDEEAEGLLSSMSDSGDESDLLTSRNNPL